MSASLRAAEILRVVAAAAPLAFLAIAYAAVARSGTPFAGLDAGWLRAMMEIELLAIHSFVFLLPLVVFRTARPEARALMWFALLLLLGIYCAASYKLASWPGVIAFVSLATATYLGAFLNRVPEGAGLRLSVRWVCNLIFVAIAFHAAGVDGPRGHWTNTVNPLVAGMWFFGLSALMEATGIYHARGWADAETRFSPFWTSLRYQEASSYSLAEHVRFGIVPVLGTLLLCAAPLVLGALLVGALTERVDAAVIGSDWREQWFQRQRVLKSWIPPLLAVILITWRSLQILWAARSLNRDPQWAWARSLSLWSALAALTAAYAACGYWLAADGWRESSSLLAFDPLAKFALAEVIVLLVLAPTTWRAVVATQRRPA